jgi:hypothetical protein
MRADTEDQLHLPEQDRGGFPIVKLLLAVAVLVALLLFWYWSTQEATEEAVAVPPIPEMAKPVLSPAPDIPKRPEPAPQPVPEPVVENVQPAPAVLPSAQESDQLLLEQLSGAGTDARLNGLVGTERPVEVSAALLDGVSRGIVLRKILPASAPSEPFGVTEQGDVTYMSTESYQRYDDYADSISALDSALLVDSFHLLRPIYERAYEQMGMDPGDFDNAIIRTLDLILATPEIEDPIPLETKSVMYIYADPKLEQMSSLQKQLLRMGPDNIRRVKAQARAVRAGLLQP